MNIEDMISAVQKKVGVQVDGRAGTKTWGPIIGDVATEAKRLRTNYA